MTTRKRRLLAVASGGGHWVQLMRLRPAFEQCEINYLTTNSDYSRDVGQPVHVVTDANMWKKLDLVRMFWEVLLVMLRVRPDIVITTGAAPGFAAIVFGRCLGARTVWIDSIANSEELSSSGKRARWFASAWVTQWPHLSGNDTSKPGYWGSVL